MPSIPKYNQNKTTDLNYAKRRVVNAEKKGIARLASPGMKDVTGGDAQKIAEKILEYLDEVMILIQKVYSYFDEVNPTDVTQYFLLRNDNDNPKVFASIIIISKFTSKILNLAKKLRNVINFVDPQTIESLKNKLEELDYLGGSFKENLLSQFVDYIRGLPNEHTIENYISETESIVDDFESYFGSDLDSSDLDIIGNDIRSDVTERSDDIRSDVTERSDDIISDISELTDDFGSDETESSSTRRRTASRRYGIGRNIMKMYSKIVNKFLIDFSESYNILMSSINNYNEARVKLEVDKKYSSSKTYSVGNKYAEQLYNSQGLYK